MGWILTKALPKLLRRYGGRGSEMLEASLMAVDSAIESVQLGPDCCELGFGLEVFGLQLLHCDLQLGDTVYRLVYAWEDAHIDPCGW